MEAFTDLFHEHCDLPKTAILLAYGMAEATLAISLKRPNETWWQTLSMPRYCRRRLTPARDGETSIEHVSCGIPFPGRVAAPSEQDERLGEGREGELCVAGSA